MVGIGTSMGGNFLLKYAGEKKKECLLKALVVISAPFDMVLMMRSLGDPWHYFGYYDKFILGSLKFQAKAVSQFLLANPDAGKQKNINMEEVLNSKSTYEFDKNLMVKLYDFKNVEQYYRKANSNHVMSEISVPALAISSRDDPIVTSSCIPYREFESNTFLAMAVTTVGGHIGWFSGFLTPKRWFTIPAFEFFEAVLKNPVKRD